MDEPTDTSIGRNDDPSRDPRYTRALEFAEKLARRSTWGDERDEIVQLVGIDVWQALKKDPRRFSAPGELEAFVHTALAHKRIDLKRRAKIEIAMTDLEATPEGKGLEQLEKALDPEPWELGRVIAAALDPLPDAPREVWYAMIHRGLSKRDVARERGVSVNTVNTQYQAAARAVRRAADRYEEGGR